MPNENVDFTPKYMGGTKVLRLFIYKATAKKCFLVFSKTLISHYIIAVHRCDELKEGERETTECD